MKQTPISKSLNRKAYRQFSVSMSETVTNKFLRIAEKSPELNQSQIVAMCVNTIFDYGLYGSEIEKFRALQELGQLFSTVNVPAIEKKQQKVVTTREDLITSLGGEIKGDTVKYTRYEKTGSGKIVALDRSIPLGSLPEDTEELRKLFLGGFATLSEAEGAFKGSQ